MQRTPTSPPADPVTAGGAAHEGPRFDTVVVAGGRSARLGGTPKALLPVAGFTLLTRTVDAVLPFGTVVVVGPEDLPLPSHVLRTREEPAFSGPAAAVAAGVVALATIPERLPWTAVLACDMPDVHRALVELRSAAERAASDVPGLIAVTGEGRRENLVVLARTDALPRALEAAPTENASLRSVWRRLGPQEVTVPPGSTSDVDTWEDVHRLDSY